MSQIDQQPLFSSTHNALLFAFNFSSQQYDRPLMNRLADDPTERKGEPKGLAGMDGAAQAGMILSRVMMLSPLEQYIVFAQYAPHSLPCDCLRPCCSRKKPNPFWEKAVAEITRSAVCALPSGTITFWKLRSAIVKKHFGKKSDVLGAAEACGVKERTAYEHQASIKRWLDGYVRKGKVEVVGVRSSAFEHVSRILKDSGIVGTSESQ